MLAAVKRILDGVSPPCSDALTYNGAGQPIQIDRTTSEGKLLRATLTWVGDNLTLISWVEV
jgi:hypothetical protein